jgi:hypothetical protein
MRALFLVTFQILALVVVSQEPKKGLGLDIGTSPSFVSSEPVEADNWIGNKPEFGLACDAVVNWRFPKDRAAIGLGGGLLLWGDRVLYPVFIQLTVEPSIWCTDCAFSRGIWLRTSLDARLGAMLGHVETTAGPLRPDLFYEVGFKYRLGVHARLRFHAGIRLNMFSFRGPYQNLVEGSWRDSKPVFLTAGPALWMAL